MKKIIGFALVIVMILGIIPVYASAGKKSYKAEIENMIKDLEVFESALLYEIDITEPKIGSSKKIELNKDRMTRISALVLEYSLDDLIYSNYDVPDPICYYSVKEPLLKKAGKNIFGKKLKASYISSEERSEYKDVYKDKQYGVVYREQGDIHSERGYYEVFSVAVKKKGKKYIASKKSYLGYPGCELTGESNYSIFYTLKKSAKSDYGYIITNIEVKRTGKTYTYKDLYDMMITDEDEDMIPTIMEYKYGTDPNKADTDGDGINDYIELLNNMDPLDPNDKDKMGKTHDADFDGLSDYDEMKEYNTDPMDSDTDDDHLSDGFEVEHGFNPLKKDTDGDGIIDGEEKIEQTFEFTMSSLGWKYEELLESIGQKKTYFGNDIYIPEDIGALKKVSIKASVPGDIDYIFTIRNLFGEHVLLTGNPTVTGLPIEIGIEKDLLKNGFESADVIFEYDEAYLIEGTEEYLNVVYFNGNNNWPEFVSGAELDINNNTISFKINKPGYYYMVVAPTDDIEDVLRRKTRD